MSGNIIDKVKSLYEIMKDERIQELEIISEEHKIYIKRKDYDDRHNSSDDYTVIQKNIKEQKFSSSNKEQKESVAVSSIISNETIKSPIMGVFYRSPSPSSAVFVSEGDIVEIGRTICIVEAMKVMNEIKSTFKTKILKILVENGKSVNLNQDLFEVEKV